MSRISQRYTYDGTLVRRSPSPVRSLFENGSSSNFYDFNQNVKNNPPVHPKFDSTLLGKALPLASDNEQVLAINPQFQELYCFLLEAQLEHYYGAFTRQLKTVYSKQVRNVDQIKYVTQVDLEELGFSRPEQRRLKKFFERYYPQTAMGKLKKSLHYTNVIPIGSPNVNRVITRPVPVEILTGPIRLSRNHPHLIQTPTQKFRQVTETHGSSIGSVFSMLRSSFTDLSINSQNTETASFFIQDDSQNPCAEERCLHDFEVMSSNMKCHFIPSNQLEFNSTISQGEFGTVVQGSWKSHGCRVTPVAIKIINQRFISNQEITRAFETEDDGCSLMDVISLSSSNGFRSQQRIQINWQALRDMFSQFALIQSIEHPDIMKVYGISWAPAIDGIRVISELAPMGSILEILRDQNKRANYPVTSLHKFCLQIVRGMSYLEEQGLVHRDLAARNILLFSKDRVKISDYGLSRMLQQCTTGGLSGVRLSEWQLPVAWSSPEVLSQLLFSSASDVWAFGVTVWELFTYGLEPWSGLSAKQIQECTEAHMRLTQPDACPDALYDAVVRACWTHDPRTRPSFAVLLTLLLRLCPERWRAQRDYIASEDEDYGMSNGLSTVYGMENPEDSESDDETPENQEYGRLNSSKVKRMDLKVGEQVYVLNKKSGILWKVISHSSGRIGYVPPAVLRSFNNSKATMASNNNNINSNGLESQSDSLRSSRRSICNFEDKKCFGGSLSNKLRRSSRRERSVPPSLSVEMISGPISSKVEHRGHLGADGSSFGEVDSKIVDKFNETKRNFRAQSEKPQQAVQKVARIRSIKNKHESPSSSIFTRKFSVGSSEKPVSPLVSKPVEKELFSDSTDLDFDIKFDFDSGGSLMDEVFKCLIFGNDTTNKEIVKVDNPVKIEIIESEETLSSSLKTSPDPVVTTMPKKLQRSSARAQSVGPNIASNTSVLPEESNDNSFDSTRNKVTRQSLKERIFNRFTPQTQQTGLLGRRRGTTPAREMCRTHSSVAISSTGSAIEISQPISVSKPMIVKNDDSFENSPSASLSISLQSMNMANRISESFRTSKDNSCNGSVLTLMNGSSGYNSFHDASNSNMIVSQTCDNLGAYSKTSLPTGGLRAIKPTVGSGFIAPKTIGSSTGTLTRRKLSTPLYPATSDDVQILNTNTSIPRPNDDNLSQWSEQLLHQINGANKTNPTVYANWNQFY